MTIIFGNRDNCFRRLKQYEKNCCRRTFITMEQFENLRLIATKEYPVKEVIEQEKLINREVPYLLSPPDKGGATRLLDVGEGRLKIMDEANIDVQVLSLVLPGVQVFDPAGGTALAKKANNRLAEIIAANSTDLLVWRV